MNKPIPRLIARLPALLFLTEAIIFPDAAIAADEICKTCDGVVSVNGEFKHRKEPPTLNIEGTGERAEDFREDVHRKDFTVTIANLPAGIYSITVGTVETESKASGERVFDVKAGDMVLADDFDIFAKAGSARKVATIEGAVEKVADELRGPLRIRFTTEKGDAKFNNLVVRNADGESVASVRAADLANEFSAAATRVPDVKEPPIWRDPSQSVKARAEDLIRRMSLAEKVGQERGARDTAARSAGV